MLDFDTFAEVQAVESVEDAAALEALGVDRRRLLALVHSGSRGLGAEIAAELNQRLAEGLPMIPGSPGAAGDAADLPVTLPDECSVPVA